MWLIMFVLCVCVSVVHAVYTWEMGCSLMPDADVFLTCFSTLFLFYFYFLAFLYFFFFWSLYVALAVLDLTL